MTGFTKVWIVFGLFLVNGCLDSGESNEIEKTRQLAALRNVKLQFDSAGIDLILPDTIRMRLHFLADNTDEKAEDARFEGLISSVQFDTSTGNPLRVITEAFQVPRDSIVNVTGTGVMDRQTHKASVHYIFRQMIDGLNVEGVIRDTLLYDLGSFSGKFEVPPPIPVSIPTRADSSTKEILRGLIKE